MPAQTTQVPGTFASQTGVQRADRVFDGDLDEPGNRSILVFTLGLYGLETIHLSLDSVRARK
ncbi:hypothetical protein G6011_07848 [Alternaria panax]|uniref:Uncharacterized protein n=1 Tax=Alternaria panax TaxID=48097 RepID=A0AAD4F7P5_9PLEO|nr:hypothetical protein G6011_07848 [Alternaria panax]